MAAGVLGAGPAWAGSGAGSLDLTPYRGKVLYLDFWASWCGPCKLSFPFMAQMVSSFRRPDFAVLTINVDHARARAEDFLSQNNFGLPVAFDPSGAIARQFNVRDMPTSILFDRSGANRFVHEGFFQGQVSLYESHIWGLLNEK